MPATSRRRSGGAGSDPGNHRSSTSMWPNSWKPAPTSRACSAASRCITGCMTCPEAKPRRRESPGRARFGRGGAGVRTTAVGALLLVVGTGAVRADTGSTTFVYPPWQHCYGLHRVTQTHLTLRAGFRYKFDDPEGVAAMKLAAEDDTTTTKDD